MAIAFLVAVISGKRFPFGDLGEKGTRQRTTLVGQNPVDEDLGFFIIIIFFNFICDLRLLLIP